MGHGASLLCETLRERLRSGQVGIGHWEEEPEQGHKGTEEKLIFLVSLVSPSPHLPISLVSPTSLLTFDVFFEKTKKI